MPLCTRAVPSVCTAAAPSVAGTSRLQLRQIKHHYRPLGTATLKLPISVNFHIYWCIIELKLTSRLGILQPCELHTAQETSTSQSNDNILGKTLPRHFQRRFHPSSPRPNPREVVQWKASEVLILKIFGSSLQLIPVQWFVNLLQFNMAQISFG